MNVRQIAILAMALCMAGATTEGAPAKEQPQRAAVPAQQAAATVAVLGYGSIGKKTDAISVQDFQQQMRYLQSEGIRPVSLQDFMMWRAGLLALPHNAVLLTFENVDATFVRDVFPILRACQFPFLIFVDTQKLGTSSEELSVRDVQMMSRLGAGIGCVSGDAESEKRWQEAELKGNAATQALAEQELGTPARCLRYLCGSCDAYSHSRKKADVSLLRHLVRQGFAVAFSRAEGKATPDSPGFMLPRYAVDNTAAFARAVNFGEKGGDVSIEASMEDSRQVNEIPSDAMAMEFEDDMVAEEVEDEEDETPAEAPQKDIAAAEPPAPAGHPTRVDSPSHAEFNVPEPALLVPDPVVLPGVTSAKAPATAPKVDTVPPAAPQAGEAAAEPVAPTPAAPQPEATAAASDAPQPQQMTPEPPVSEAEVGKLVRRDQTGDWVTAAFRKPLVPREQTRVAVLGYHNFSNTKPISEMRMRTYEFCQQMQYIKDAGLTVISMQDFIEWRFGNRCLPERCILITIDDGWKSVYTDAYPVLKAYGYPFTMFLYTRYIDVHGDSMTEAQIREMMENGATIGSHSSNHLYPSAWKKNAQDSPAYAEMVQKELLDSGVKLKDKFGACSTYCYPGGYHTPPMIEGLKTSDYKLAFTVIESKVECTEDPWQVHRYMVFGVDPNIFRRAVNFDGEQGIIPTRMGIAAAIKPAREFFPAAFEGTTPGSWSQQNVSGRIAKRVSKARKGQKPAAPKAQPAPAAPAAPVAPAATPVAPASASDAAL